MKRILIIIAMATLSLEALGQDFTLQNLSESDYKNFVKDASANFNHTSVSPASSLGSIFGFEVGLVGGITKTKNIDKLVKAQDSSASAEQLPHGEIIGLLTVPFGITGELGFVPKVGSDDFKFQSYTIGVKWTPTDFLLELPLSLAIRGHYTKSKAEMKQTISNVPTSFDYEQTGTSIGLVASKNFVIVEPYIGINLVNGKGDMTVTGSTTVFNSSFTSSQSASASVSGTSIQVGAELKLLIFKLGLEYANVLSADQYSAKLALYF
ncbi:MAG: DUF6588 family protein [Bdellovibrionales bacterium]